MLRGRLGTPTRGGGPCGTSMEPPRERLPERRDTILASGARLMVTLKERNGTTEIYIQGNRPGLRALAAICAGLAELTPEQLLTPANHYHLDEHVWGTEPGSTPLTLYRRDSGWPDASE